MTTTWMDTAAPRVRPGVRIGMPLLEGNRVVHIIADSETGSYLRVGEREAFLIGLLDGGTSLTEAGNAYAARFGRRMGEENWGQLLGLLHAQALLEPADPSAVADIRDRADAARRDQGRRFLLRRFPLLTGPDIGRRAHGLLGWLLAPAWVLLGVLAGSAATGWAFTRMGDLFGAAGDSGAPVRSMLLGVALTWLAIAAHEYGHAVACVRYGGRPREIGVMWRPPLLAPYCKVDDIVVFSRRSHQVMTAFAGVYVNLLLQPVLAWAWASTPGQGWLHGGLAVALLGNTAAVVVNLIPVLQLDGYRMLEGSVGSLHLQRHAATFAGLKVKRDRAQVATYEPRARWLYGLYAIFAVLLVGPAFGALIYSWFTTLADLWSPLAAAAVLIAEFALIVTLGRWYRRRQQDRQEQGVPGAAQATSR